MAVRVTAIVALAWTAVARATEEEPNPPPWPSSVRVFSPTDGDIQAAVYAAFASNGGHAPPNKGQFSSARYAFLFRPGTYPQDVPVGFYTTVHGLGATPDDVVFNGPKGVHCEEGDYNATTGALDNFWRGAENFRSSASHAWTTGTGMLWAVSQASPLRRVHVDASLVLYQYVPPYYEAGFASGGFLADAVVEGGVIAGSQQQWLSRNVHMTGGEVAASLAVWNSVYVGCTGAVPAAHCGERNKTHSTVVVAETPSIAEKPYLTVTGAGDDERFAITVPALRAASAGASWRATSEAPAAAAAAAAAAPPANRSIDFAHVYVARAGSDSAASINAKLGAAHIQAVLLTPGIYRLEAPLTLTRPGTVLLGIGLPTLVPTTTAPAVEVGAPSARVSGVLLQAGAAKSSSLLHVAKAATGTVLHDVFARVGGPDASEVQAETMVHIEADGVVGDNLWLWRADHTVSGIVVARANPCDHGLVVDGDGVTMYGLAVEHTLADLTVWNGERGAVYFYQSELPYDVQQSEFGDRGYAGYRVADHVTAHLGAGVGVYHYFRDFAVKVAAGIVAPATASFTSPLGVFLNGKGYMGHVLNQQGDATQQEGAHQAYVCEAA